MSVSSGSSGAFECQSTFTRHTHSDTHATQVEFIDADTRAQATASPWAVRTEKCCICRRRGWWRRRSVVWMYCAIAHHRPVPLVLRMCVLVAVCSCNTFMSGCTCINNGNNAMAIIQWVLLPALATHSTRLVCVAHTAVCSVAMLPYLLSVRAAVVVARVPGRPGIGGRTNRAARVSTHKYTYDVNVHTRKHTRTYAYTHTSPFPASSSFPAPPVVLVTAIRPGHRLLSMSPPFVLVTAIRPSCVAHTAVCSVAMLPCLLFVDACSTDDPVPALPPWPSAWNCTCTAPMTDGLKLPGCALRCHIRRRGRTGVRPCAALRSHLLPPPGQPGGKKK